MFEVTFTGLRERLQSLDRLEREQLPFAAALALTTTAQDVKEALVDEMRTVFDRPTRFTLNSLFVETATKDRLSARVWMKDAGAGGGGGGRSAAEWLAPQIYGGGRDQKASEKRLGAKGALPGGKYIVPGKGLKLDAHGNISRSKMRKILSGVDERRRYFIMKKGNRPIGIAERTGKGQDGLRMVIAFARRPQYGKQFDFFRVAKRTAEDRLPVRFELALARALATRRR